MKKILLAMSLSLGLNLAINSTALAATEGVDYEIMPKTVQSLPDNKDKIEVTEFFGYFCIHCKNLDPTLLAHIKTLPSDTVFRTEHVVWDEEAHLGFARLAVAINETHLKQEANPLIWQAVFDKKINLGDPAVASQWLAEQTAFDGKKVLAAFNSFSNQAQAKKMGEYTAQYDISGTPTLVVGGKYRVLFPNGYAQGMKVMDELIAKVRQERGMKAPTQSSQAAPDNQTSQTSQTNQAVTQQPAKLVKSKGASFAKKAIKALNTK